MVGPRVSGGLVNLRSLQDDDLSRRVLWLSDDETVKLFTGGRPDRPYTLTDAERWRHSTEADPLTIVWAIETKGNRHIGDVDIHDINRAEGRGRLTILIGNRDFWGRGFGSDAVTAVLGYGFETLGLRSMNLRVCDFNQRAIRCYEKCGFERDTSDMRIPGWQPGDLYMVATRERYAALQSDGRLVHA